MVRILLVEDDPDVRLVFEDMLADASYQVEAAPTVGGGTALLAAREYDLVVTDGRLPDGLGTKLADQARDKGVPSIIVTGYAFERDIDFSKYTVLQKPVLADDLLAAIARALGVA